MTTQDVFKKLGLAQEQSGGCLSSPGSIATAHAEMMESRNPATEELLARVYGCTEADYDELVARAQEVQASWRMVPALFDRDHPRPRRVRDPGVVVHLQR